jgi:alkylation response protein AidB-like acyl-CoA dehydrogenase
LGEDSLVQYKMAEARIENEFLRLLVYDWASLRSKGEPAAYQAYMIKLWEGEVWQRIIDAGVQIFGMGAQVKTGKYALFMGMMEPLYRAGPIMYLPGSPNMLRNGIAAYGLGMES